MDPCAWGHENVGVVHKDPGVVVELEGHTKGHGIPSVSVLAMECLPQWVSVAFWAMVL